MRTRKFSSTICGTTRDWRHGTVTENIAKNLSLFSQIKVFGSSLS